MKSNLTLFEIALLMNTLYLTLKTRQVNANFFINPYSSSSFSSLSSSSSHLYHPSLLSYYTTNNIESIKNSNLESKDEMIHSVVPNSLEWKKIEMMERRQKSSGVLHFIELAHNYSSGFMNQKGCLAMSSQLKFPLLYHKYDAFKDQAKVAIRAANLITNLLINHLKPSSSSNHNFNHDRQNWINLTLSFREILFPSLIKANVQSDPKIFGSGIVFKETFDPFNSSKRYSSTKYSNEPNLNLFSSYVYQNVHSQSKPFVYVDLVNLPWKGYSVDEILTNGQKGPKRRGYYEKINWFTIDDNQNYTYPNLGRILNERSVKGDKGFWTPPYLDCNATNTWLISYCVPFFDSKHHNLNREIKGVVIISINLMEIDINQCSQDDPFFANTHKCHNPTSQCLPIPGLGFRRGSYICKCKSGFYNPSQSLFSSNSSNFHRNNHNHYFNGTVIEEWFVSSLSDPSQNFELTHKFSCKECQDGCETCADDTPCFVTYNHILRSIILGLQSFCATLTLILTTVIFRYRRYKIIASSRWILLETILIGAFFIYITVIIRYFEPTPLTCFIEPWFRELGFAFCFGSITIKLYRIFAEFQTRKAHRVCVRDKDLLKYLCGIILVVIGYMAAWSALVLDSLNGLESVTENKVDMNILQEGKTWNGLRYYVCRELSWDYVTEIGEFFFLITGVYITYCIRNAKLEIYNEKWTLCFCIYIEMIVSSIAYVIKHCFWAKTHPDFTFLLYFIRCQLSITFIILILFCPKVWFPSRPQTNTRKRPRCFSTSEVRDRVPKAMKFHAAILSNGDVDIGDINLADMDPEDIRSELRRVYTQLQILKNKTMRKDNPHISKRRGGRKGTHRRFSLQPFHKHKHHEPEHETTEVSRTSEESTTSGEGPSCIHPDGPSMTKIEQE